MALFPQSFLDDLKAQTDIASIINEVTPLKKAGATLKGLCPFHQEKTPSFNVNRDKGFFKCFGCGAGGDAVKFVELHQKVSFPEAVRYLATRAGMTVPERPAGPEDQAAAAEREALIKIHEEAVAFYQDQLESASGARARRELASRGLGSETIRTFRYGYAPAGGRDTLQAWLTSKKVPEELQLRSGLVVRRERGDQADFFRNRLMIPIARDTGSIVAFGGRALDEGQQPEVPQFAGNADLHEGPNPVRVGRDERGDKEAQLQCSRRGVFRPGTGVAGRRPAGPGGLRHGADQRPGAGVETICLKSRPEFRSRYGRPGSRRPVLGAAGERGVPGQRGPVAGGK